MDRAGYSNLIELKNYGQVPQSDAESGVSQDKRSYGTRAIKWVANHPFLAAATAIGLLGATSGGIYALTLLGAAAPVATALSARNVTLPGAVVPDVTALSGQNKTYNTTTTKVPTTRLTSTEEPTTEEPTCTAVCVTCTGNDKVNPLCCNELHPLRRVRVATWKSNPDGVVPADRSITCYQNSSQCTNKSGLITLPNDKDSLVVYHNSMDAFCQDKKWGSASYTVAAAPVTTALSGRHTTNKRPISNTTNTEALTTKTPTTEDSTTKDSTIEASTTKTPTTKTPTTEDSTTKDSNTEALTTKTPTTKDSTTKDSTTEASTNKTPTTEDSNTKTLTTESPTSRPG
ncbi:hypothetical protein ACTL6P_11960 [Endozoicomonas acroporae]|uniref:hypothetical protein n=1 Tax=Endozoicomonas acroporae TaxID=1701104 RepID=UPI000C770A0D|nr:hypothetical protein [Endozoicomonas acroporae]